MFCVNDDRFPSGPWTGFYNYTGPEDRRRMDLHLTFARGRMVGEGRDDIGPFSVRGTFDAASGECSWVKSYRGSHDVLYRGCGDEHGIWGQWEIPPWTRGGFHIWPRRAGEGDSEKLSLEEPVPAEAYGTEVKPEETTVPRR